jgi:hypothetical protein
MWTVKVAHKTICRFHKFKIAYRFAKEFKGSLTYIPR